MRPFSIPSYQLPSIWLFSKMMSPSLKDNSAGFSASKLYKAWQEGCALRVGVDTGEGLGDAAAAGCGFQAFSPDAGLPHPLLVGVPEGDTPGDVELSDEQVTGKFLSIVKIDLIQLISNNHNLNHSRNSPVF